MRRVIGLVLIGIGAFLIVLAPLVRFQVAPSLIAAPANQYGISKLEAVDAQYFSPGDLKVMTGDLDITVTTRGDVAAAEGDRVVWEEAMAVNDVTNQNPLINFSERRSAFNKYTGEGVNCCAELNRLVSDLSQDLGRAPTVAELAAKMNISE
ncbi:porin PorA family protein, partial [Streptosporangium sp. NPDC048865]|uniref:porin PorA family protein n=1 Tax=Streptosporangium sp. NPDC048865 TaxID=3155766 RepID=UPI0034480631